MTLSNFLDNDIRRCKCTGGDSSGRDRAGESETSVFLWKTFLVSKLSNIQINGTNDYEIKSKVGRNFFAICTEMHMRRLKSYHKNHPPLFFMLYKYEADTELHFSFKITLCHSLVLWI